MKLTLTLLAFIMIALMAHEYFMIHRVEVLGCGPNFCLAYDHVEQVPFLQPMPKPPSDDFAPGSN